MAEIYGIIILFYMSIFVVAVVSVLLGRFLSGGVRSIIFYEVVISIIIEFFVFAYRGLGWKNSGSVKIFIVLLLLGWEELGMGYRVVN